MLLDRETEASLILVDHDLSTENFRRDLSTTDKSYFFHMSNIRELEIQNGVRQLKEMFPNHSPATIERVLRNHRGVIDSAISQLLDTKPDAPQAHKPQQKQHRASTRGDGPSHIFPEDFLRWPQNARAVRINEDGTEEEVQPMQRTTYQPPQHAHIPPVQNNYPAQVVVTPAVNQTDNGSKPVTGWQKFKARFKGANYQPI